MLRQSLIEYGKPLAATEAETPRPQGSEVLLRVSHCGVCHSDLHLQDGYFDLGGGRSSTCAAPAPLPFTFGHEIAGTVEAAGPEAQGVAVGKRYAAYPWIGCGKCGVCARGDEHLCNAPRALGVTVDGGYATHVLVPHPRYLLDVEGIAPEIAGPLMCSGLTGYGAVKKALPYLRIGPLLIVGLGGVGMMGLQFARALTDAPILVADIDAAKREAALKLGAREAFDPADAGARKAIAKASGGGVGAAVDFAGSDKSLALRPVGRGQGRRGHRRRPARRQLHPAGADVPAARAHRHGQLRRLDRRRRAEMIDLVKAGRIAPIPGRDAAARPRPAARSTICAPAGSSAASSSRPEGSHSNEDHRHGLGRRRRLLRRAPRRRRQRRDVRGARRPPRGDAEARPAARQRDRQPAPQPGQGRGRRRARSPAADAVIFAVKMRDTESAAESLRALAAKGATIFTFQNGVESGRRIGQDRRARQGGGGRGPHRRAHRRARRHQADRQLRHPGVRRGRRQAQPAHRAFHAACVAAGINATLSGNISRTIWAKFAMLAPVSGMTALTRGPIGPVRANAKSRALLQAAVEEAVALGVALKTGLVPEDAARTMKLIDGLPSGNDGLDVPRPAGRKADRGGGPVGRRGAAGQRERRAPPPPTPSSPRRWRRSPTASRRCRPRRQRK